MRTFFIITLLLIANHSYSQCPADEDALEAGGTFSGTCTIGIGASANITNTVIFTSGTLTLTGGAGNLTVSGAGSITIQSGATLDIEDGSLTVSGGASFTTAGVVSIDDGIFITGETSSADFQVGSTTTLDGDFEILHSDVTVAGTLTDTQIDQDEILLRGTSVLTVNFGANISDFDDIEFRNGDGASSLIINGGLVSIVDDLDLRPNQTDGDFVEVNGGTLDVGDNIAIAGTVSDNLLIINAGGTVTSDRINGNTPTDPADLPAGVIVSGGDLDIGGNVLPVELISFSSTYDEKTNLVELIWSTATEINNEGFYIERSPIGTQSFKQIGFIKGNGNSKEVLNYAFKDRDVFSNHYYRLKQVDYDGAFEYSPVILNTVESTEKFNLRLFPNPSTRSNISIESIPDVEFSASLYNLQGVELFNTSVTNVELVQALINDSLESATPGIYLFIYSNRMTKKTIRIVKE